MQDGARFFAYSTWAIMVSLGIMIFSHQFLSLADSHTWGYFIWIPAFAFLYFNLTYAAVKRYIKKVPAPTNSHILLALIILLPPVFWIGTINEPPGSLQYVTLVLLAASTAIGVIAGNKRGIKARYEYVQKLKQYQKNQDK